MAILFFLVEIIGGFFYHHSPFWAYSNCGLWILSWSILWLHHCTLHILGILFLNSPLWAYCNCGLFELLKWSFWWTLIPSFFICSMARNVLGFIANSIKSMIPSQLGIVCWKKPTDFKYSYYIIETGNLSSAAKINHHYFLL